MARPAVVYVAAVKGYWSPLLITLVPLIGLGVSGCGKAAPDAQAPVTPPLLTPPTGETGGLVQAPEVRVADEAIRRASRVEARCGDQDCHPSIGFLAVAVGRVVSECTAFFVSDSVIATASHCIPDELKLPGVSCHGRAWVAFPAVGSHPAQRFECARVLKASALSVRNLGPDYAFVSVQGTSDRPPLQTDHRGFEDGATVHLLKADSAGTDEAPVGVLRSEACGVVQRSYLLPTFDQAGRPLVSLSRCTVSSANAGAPIIARAGAERVLGILQSSVELTELQRLNLIRQGLLNVTPEGLAIGTSFACIPASASQAQALPDQLEAEFVPTADLLADPVCHPAEPADPLDYPLVQSDINFLHGRLLLTLRDWMNVHSVQARAMEWTVELQASRRDPLRPLMPQMNDSMEVAHAAPVCVRDPLALRSRQARELSLPAWSYRIQLNSLLQKRLVPNSQIGRASLPARIALSTIPTQDESERSFRVSISVSHPSAREFFVYRQDQLSFCR